MLKIYNLLCFSLITAIFVSAFVSAQEKRVLPQTIALTNATVIDVKNGRRLQEMTVVVSGNKISAVGRGNRIKVPEKAQIVDASGKFLIPGLWDMHVHAWDADVFTRLSWQMG